MPSHNCETKGYTLEEPVVQRCDMIKELSNKLQTMLHRK